MPEIKFNKKILLACIIIALLIPPFFFLKFHISGESKPMNHILVGFLYSFIISVSVFVVNIKTVNWCHRLFSGEKKFFKRIVFEMLVTNFNAVLIIIINVIIFYYIFGTFSRQTFNIVLFNNITVVIIVNTLATLFLEVFYYFKRWKTSIIQTEKLKRENIMSQFQALKNQIDPHFLFNSMNTIYSLIDTQPDKAKEFISKFSKIYRRVLDVKEKVVVSLKEEVEFLNSYIYLQKIRYQGNLELSINIDAQKLNSYILPLSLQMLVENAIKHNIISEKKTLKIEVFNNNDSLIVKNNLQPKDAVNESTKIGLNNLAERYKHISEKAPKFYIKDSEYIAEIPLLNED